MKAKIIIENEVKSERLKIIPTPAITARIAPVNNKINANLLLLWSSEIFIIILKALNSRFRIIKLNFEKTFLKTYSPLIVF